MKNKHFILVGVEPLDGMRLRLTYADGAVLETDIAPLIARHPSLQPIASVFHTAALGDFGYSVIWDDNDELELAADNLRARALEQRDEFSHETIINWMARHHFTLEQAAEELGLSRRMLGYYLSGEKPVPRTVALACIGWTHAARDRRFALAA